MVLVHGGLGTAFPGWVDFWVSQGYAAIAMDTCGGCAPQDVLKHQELSFPGYPGVRSFEVHIRSLGETPVAAILSLPEQAQPKSLPAYVFFHGAGVRPPFPPLTWAKHGFLALNVSALGLEYGREDQYYRQMEEKFADYSSLAARLGAARIEGAGISKVPSGVGRKNPDCPRRQSRRVAVTGRGGV